MSANLPITWLDKKNSPELEAFLKQYGDQYCMKAEEINQLRDAVNEMAVIQQSTFLGAAEPTDIPAGTGRAYWISVKPGTYTNHGGVVVAANEIAFIIRDAVGAFSISKTGLDLSGYQKIVDSNLNLYPNSNYGLIFTKIGGSLAFDNLPVATYQTGTPVATVLQNFEGFNSAVKVTLKVGDRLNIYSSLLKTNALTISTTIKFNAGFYIKVPSSYTGTIDLYLVKSTLASNVNLASDVEFVQLGNNWRYYRLKQGFLVDTTDNVFHVGIYLNNISGSVLTDLHIAAPSLLRTDTKITPGIYSGIDSLKDYTQFLSQSDLASLYLNNYDPEGNLLLDHKFSKQTVIGLGTSPWYTLAGNGAVSFSSPASISNIATPIGNTSLLMQHSKRSSDSKFTDYQLYQGFVVPVEQRSNAVWSFGFWMKRDTTNASFLTLAQYYFANENFTTGIAGVSSSPTISNEVVGNWVFVKYNNITLPAGTKSAVVFIRVQHTGVVLDSITNVYITGITVNMRSGIINGSLQNQKELTAEIVAPLLPVGTPLNYTDLYELNNNQFKDAIFVDQTVGASAFSGLNWAMASGGANRYQGNYSIMAIDSPVGNNVLAIDVTKRSSDGFSTDNQPTQGILIPIHLRGRVATCSFGFWMKRVNSVPLIAAVATAYSDELFVTAITNASHTATITNEVVGNWVFVKINNIPLPTNAKSIRLSARVSWDPAVLTPVDTIYKAYLTGFVVDFTGNPLLGYTRNTDEKIATAVGNIGGALARLKGKKWCSFGDSITAANAYQTAVINRYGLVHYLRGIGGSGVSEGSQIAWVDANGLYITRPPATQPAGSFQILSQAYQQDRVNTIPTDTNIITIMFGANDYSLALGVIDDTSAVNTFYGKYQQMLDLIYARIPNAEIVLLTPTFLGYETTGNIDLKREAIFKIGKKYAYRVIDVGGECGINKNNSTVYLADGVHPNTVGYNRMSIPLINDFIKIYG
jgi:lysophospholipase L1-like esterase